MMLKAFTTTTATINQQYHISDVTNNGELSYGMIKITVLRSRNNKKVNDKSCDEYDSPTSDHYFLPYGQ